MERLGWQVRWVRTAGDVRAALRTESAMAAAVVSWELPKPGEVGDGTGADV